MNDPARALIGVPESMLAAAARVADHCRTSTPDDLKKRWGQYFTSAPIAAFMARLVEPPRADRTVRILDPGAGTGILGVALAERLLHEGRRVHLVAVEAEPTAIGHLEGSLRGVQRRFRARFSFEAKRADFLELDAPTQGAAPIERFDVAIGNPPYSKISPGEVRGGDAPNVYARFMEVSARLLVPGGQLCFIVPRSFAAGHYFQRFRRRFHSEMHLTRVHVFGSRRDAFKTDGILQETLVVHYRRASGAGGDVMISSSAGEADIADLREHAAPRGLVFDASDPGASLFLPLDAEDLRIMDRVRSFHHTLANHGLEVSTGPVVPFRAERELINRPGKIETVPLLWMQHVRAARIQWPLGGGFRKAEHIRAAAAPRLLVPNATYVVIRRFSAKEEERRLIAAVLREGELPGERLGLENHLNFIHRPGGKLSIDEAVGLATLLNASMFDAYFRISSGNTQVSATELRALPLPAPDRLRRIARRAAACHGAAPDEIVADALRTN